MSEKTHAWLPLEVIKDKRLSKNHIRVLIALYAFKNKKHNKVWPSREEIEGCCGLRQTRISTITTDLVALGWLVKTGRGGFSKSTRYLLTVPVLGTVPEPGTNQYLNLVPDGVPEPGTGMGVPEPGTGKEVNKNNPLEVNKDDFLTGLEEIDAMWGNSNG